MADRVMYVKPGCPWCDMAREDLSAEGLDWEERDATTDPAWREELMRFSDGSGRVPTVVEGEQVVSVGWKGGG
jgi:glutaredoxin 3